MNARAQSSWPLTALTGVGRDLEAGDVGRVSLVHVLAQPQGVGSQASGGLPDGRVRREGGFIKSSESSGNGANGTCRMAMALDILIVLPLQHHGEMSTAFDQTCGTRMHGATDHEGRNAWMVAVTSMICGSNGEACSSDGSAWDGSPLPQSAPSSFGGSVHMPCSLDRADVNRKVRAITRDSDIHIRLLICLRSLLAKCVRRSRSRSCD